VNNASLRDFFVQFGTVMDAHVMMDRETMRNKGFGFVTFDDENGVERSMAATGMELDGKMVSTQV
jgi:RNA-binding protein Musashi